MGWWKTLLFLRYKAIGMKETKFGGFGELLAILFHLETFFYSWWLSFLWRWVRFELFWMSKRRGGYERNLEEGWEILLLFKIHAC